MKAARLRAAARSLPLLLAAVAVVAASGCAAHAPQPTLMRLPGGGDDVELTVENQNYRDATVDAVWSNGERDNLGLVVNRSTRRFVVPWKGEEMQLEMSFIAGDDVVTEPIDVARGDHLHVTIPLNGG